MLADRPAHINKILFDYCKVGIKDKDTGTVPNPHTVRKRLNPSRILVYSSSDSVRIQQNTVSSIVYSLGIHREYSK